MTSSFTQRSYSMYEYLRHHAGRQGVLSFADFMRHVLYAPRIGYYTRQGRRVGRNQQCDFYSATNLRSVFAQLVLAAVKELIRPQGLAAFTFVEIGAEPDEGLLRDCNHPFSKNYVIRLGEPMRLPDKAVVFANELLDAQPFHRLRFTNGCWREVGVHLKNTTLTEILLSEFSPEVAKVANILPPSTAEGYTLDLTLGAEVLLKKIVAPPWKGLFLTFDYGTSWTELMHHWPAGTARAYYRHSLKKDLIARPGEQDLTCHLCWDRLESILRKNGFVPVQVEHQEVFYMHHAQREISRIITLNSEKFDPARFTLREILHPIHMGHKFQALWGLRE